MMKRLSLIILGISLNLFVFQAQSQVKVHGGFFADSMRVGDHVKYFLSAAYPRKLNVLFPDSSYKYAPFEYESRQYFPTTTHDTISYDSVVYDLTSFEVDDQQILALPVYIVGALDSIAYYADADTMQLEDLVRSIPDSLQAKDLPLKMNTGYLEVPWTFNYLIAGIIVFAVIVVIVVALLLFGKRIRKYYQLRRLQKIHAQFVTSFNHRIGEMQTQYSSSTAELALAEWKKYMEQLLDKPYTKLTTPEVLALDHDEQIASFLKQIDRTIYGHDANATSAFQGLHAYAITQYSHQVELVKNG